MDKTNIIWSKNGSEFKKKFILYGHKDSIIISHSKAVKNSENEYVFYSISSSSDKEFCFWLNDEKIYSEKFNYFIFDAHIYFDLIIPGIMVLTAGSNNCVNINRFNMNTCSLEKLITLKGHNDWIKSIDIIMIDDNGILSDKITCKNIYLFFFLDTLMLASASQDSFVRVYAIKRSTSNLNDNALNKIIKIKQNGILYLNFFILYSYLSY